MQQWFKVAGRASTDAVVALTVDTNANVYVAGTGIGNNVASGKDFGGAPITGASTSTTTTDAYVAKLNSAGVQQWFKLTGSASTDTINNLAVDSSGNVIVAGTETGTSTPKDFTGTTVTGFGGTDVYAAKLNGSDGSQAWFKFTGSTMPTRSTTSRSTAAAM